MWDLTDLVEEQGAAIGELKAPDAIAVGAGERTLHVTEKLALEQLPRNRRAIHPDQRTLGARASRMNRPRHQLLADPGFAEDEHVGGGRGNCVDLQQDSIEGCALANNLAEGEREFDLFSQVVTLAFQLVFERCDAFEGIDLLTLGAPSFGDVAKHHDCAGETPLIVTDRGAGVLDRDAMAILVPEHLVVDPMHPPVLEGSVDRTFLTRIGRAVFPAVVVELVDAAPDEVVQGPAEHLHRGLVDEGRVTVAVETVDPLAGRIEDERAFAFEAMQSIELTGHFGRSACRRRRFVHRPFSECSVTRTWHPQDLVTRRGP